MKRQQNSLPRFLLLVAAMVLPLLATAGDTLSVTSLTLGDDYLSLGGKVIVKGDSILGYYDNGVPLVLPDTITVDNIAIAYAGSKKDSLKIKEGDNDSLSAQVTKGLSHDEIKTAHGGKALVLVSGKCYTITHGAKTWTLKYTATLPPPPAEEPDGNNPADEPSDKNVLLWCFIVLAIITALLLLIDCWKGIKRLRRSIKRLFTKKHTPTRPVGGDGDKEKGDPNNGDDGGTPPQKSKEDEILEKLDKLDAISAWVSELRGKIDSLQPREQQNVNGSSSSSPALTEIINKIKSSGNDDLKSIVLQAERETSSGNKKDILNKFINILSSKYKDRSQTITSEKLQDSNNYNVLLTWIIDMIHSGGYKEKLSDNASTPEALCRGIAEKLCAAEQDVEGKILERLKDKLPLSLHGDNVDDTLQKINAAEKERTDLVATERDNNEKIGTLTEKNDALLKETTEMVDRLHTAAKKLKDTRLPLLSACNTDNVEGFTNNENEFYEALQTFAGNLCSFSVADGTSPAAAREQIQKTLAAAMGDKNGVVSKLCRYYAYSQLPFMRDSNRDSGVTLNAKNVMTLYTALCNIFTPFGITFDIPALFTLSLADRNYQCVTETSDLKWLCPDMTQRIPAEWNSNRDLIIDIDTVGYSVDGEQRVQTTVLTTL